MTGRADATRDPADLLDRVLAARPPAFALVHRPETTGAGALELLVGEVSTPDTLTDVPLPEDAPHPGGRHDVLVVVPYRQISELGYAAVDDGEPLLAMTVTEHAELPVVEVLRRLPEVPTELAGGHFAPDDDTYAETVRRVIADEIGRGAGANFVIKRSFVADITDYTVDSALSLFGRLLRQESSAYWTFLVHTGERTFVGATPERHVSLHDGVAVMNPISGTLRYPPTGPTLPDVMRFLADRKEAEELYMVLDEELKMMARICETGGRVIGPYLKEMTRLAHTEYFIEGRSSRDPREILRETMFAPTVTGSPLESACRVISRYEAAGRGYYSGVVALIGRDERNARTLDSAIMIRTVDIAGTGRLRIGVGATLVRHSDPVAEVAETKAKAATLIAALGSNASRRFGQHPDVRAALRRRNANIAEFWLSEHDARRRRTPLLAGRRVLVVDAEDTFTSMLEHQLRAMELSVTVRRFDERYSFDGYDLVVMGPGPGDPRQTDHPKISHLRSALRTLLAERRPFLAVCLSHQVLSLELGFEVIRMDAPNQGVQRGIDLFGSPERLGFYNTFAATSQDDKVDCEGVGVVEVSRNAGTGEVYALRGPRFASLQFHAESVLSQDGVRIIGDLLSEILVV